MWVKLDNRSSVGRYQKRDWYTPKRRGTRCIEHGFQTRLVEQLKVEVGYN